MHPETQLPFISQDLKIAREQKILSSIHIVYCFAISNIYHQAPTIEHFSRVMISSHSLYLYVCYIYVYFCTFFRMNQQHDNKLKELIGSNKIGHNKVEKHTSILKKVNGPCVQ